MTTENTARPLSLRETISNALAEAIGSSAYDCTRVWAAWGVGTMSEDDFHPLLEGRLDEIADAVYAAIRGRFTAEVDAFFRKKMDEVGAQAKDGDLKMLALEYKLASDTFYDMLTQLMYQLQGSGWRDIHDHRIEMNTVYQRVKAALESGKKGGWLT